jgi:iron complex outermembrane receptor protein
MKMKTNRSLAAVLVGSSALIAPGLAMAILTAPTMAAAQAAPAKPANSTEVQEVVVTGTLFRTRTETAAPVTVLSQKSITQQGIVTVSDAVRSISADNSGTLPPAFPGAFAFGATGVALRGLTVNSTLVLTDGLRNADYPIGDDGVRSFVDLNTLPLAAVDHIDVLKDGASSLYGADAIGGVVNMILKPQFQGVEGTVEGGFTQHGGDANQHVDVTVGMGDLDTDKYNVYVSAEYSHDDPIRADQRPFPFNTSDLTSIGGLNPGNGQVVPGVYLNGSVYAAVAPATLNTPGDLLLATQAGPFQILNQTSPGTTGCGPLGKASTDKLGNAYCAQDLDSYLYDYPRLTRGGVYGRFSVQFNPQTVGYVSFDYQESHDYQPEGVQTIQASGPVNTTAIALPAFLPGGAPNPNNPFSANPAGPYYGDAALISYSFPDAQQWSTDHSYRGVADVKGLVSGWDYEVGLVAQYQSLDYIQKGYIYYPALIAAVTNGTYNFVNPSANSAALVNAISPTESKTATSSLYSFDVHATRPIMDLPGGPLSLGFGLHAHYEDQNNPEINVGENYENLGVDHAFGHRNVESAFLEVDAPLLHALDANLSGRIDHYSDFGTNFSPKIEIKWTPIKQLALRATGSTGFRAPSFAEKGTAAVGGFVNYTVANDPNAPASYIAAHGDDGYVTNTYALEEVTTSNPNIKPEHSQSYTVGAVIQPISNISASVDFYYIQKTDLIAPASYGAALAAYYSGQALPAGDSVVADNPDPSAPGALARPVIVSVPYTNGNSLITTGIDVELRGAWTLPYDVKLTTDFNWTDIFEYRYSAIGSPTYDYVGTESPYNLSSGAGTPKYKANWTTTLTYGPASAAVTVNYVSSIFENADDLGAPFCISTLPGNCTVSAFWDVDLHFDYKVTDKIDLFANIYNVADALPPVDQINYGGINYNPTYEEAGIIGRAFKLGVHVKY